MPEIKNTFLQGKMNKDLDERLIPNGEYRNAMNVEVSTAEDSSIGVLKNILGNHRVEDIVLDGFICVGSIENEQTNKLYWFVSKYNKDAILEYDVENDVATPIIVDTKAGTKNAVLKFSGNIITGINIIDDLLFWTDNNSEPKKININTCKTGTNSFNDHTQLSFENGSFEAVTLENVASGDTPGFQITTNTTADINFLNRRPEKGEFFWVARDSFKKMVGGFDTEGTAFYSIPSPSVDFYSSPANAGIGGTAALFNVRHYRNNKFLGLKEVFFRGAERYTSKHYGGSYGGINPMSAGSPDDFYAGDVLFGNNISIDIEERHVTVIKPKPVNTLSFKINHSDSSSGEYNIPNLFETKFPRFSYRYKYTDGEYSPFAPFTPPVFNPKYPKDTSASANMHGGIGESSIFYNKDNAYDIKEPYNRAMVNSIHSVELTNFITAKTPEDVEEIEILYKQEESSVIYSIESIKRSDKDWHLESNWESSNVGYNEQGGSPVFSAAYNAIGGDTKGRYTVTTENIYAALPANQLLRPWDNVPKKALAQEVTGSRIVYGNYVQNYNLSENIEISIDYNNRKNTINSFEAKGLPSVKSQRNYQMGVVLCDKYGRETPVFSSNEAALTIPWQDRLGNKNASKSNQLTASVVNNFPEWVDSLKFFVKENSSEYYNLTMDRAWITKKTYELDDSEGHLWISFPSSDRNKISEEDYIILKKKIGTGEEQINFENKYKVIDIKNEAPDALKYQLINMGVAKNDSNNTLTDGAFDLFYSDSSKPDISGGEQIAIEKIKWISHTKYRSGLHKEKYEAPAGGDKPLIQDDLYVSWRREDASGSGAASKKYKVTGGYVNDVAYILKLGSPITKIDADIAHVDGDSEGTPSNHLHQNLIFQIEKRVLKDAEDFSGKFFVKISKNQITDLITNGSFVSILDQFAVSSSASVWYWQDVVANGSVIVNSTNYGLTNWDGFNIETFYDSSNGNHIQHSSNNNEGPTPAAAVGGALYVTDYVDPWEGIFNKFATGKPSWFVDGMHMVAGQSESSDLAKYSCTTWSGCTKDEAESGQESAWSYPPLKTWISDYKNISNLNTSDLISEAPGLPTNPDFDDKKIDGWVGPLQTVDREKLSSLTTIENNHVNGLEGFVTTSLTHSKGPRRWFSGLNGSDYGVGSDTMTYASDDETGKHFMHLSFFAPGKDLHNTGWDLDSTNATQMIYGPKSFGANLQGIWGGGVFTGESKTELFGQTNNDDLKYQHFPMEGNYDGSFNYLPEAPGPGVGFGYDLRYKELHERQWDPTFSNSDDPDNKIRDFIRNLHAGARFRLHFRDKGQLTGAIIDDTVYTIKSVQIKKLYNHTSWRKHYNRYINGTGTQHEDYGYIDAGLNTSTPNYDEIYQSVEEVAMRWLHSVMDGGLLTGVKNGNDVLSGIASPNWGGGGLIKKIQDFGKAHNRRVCYVIELDKNPTVDAGQAIGNVLQGDKMTAQASSDNQTEIEFLDPVKDVLLTDLNKFPAIWEVDPKKQEVDLDIYYEASSNIPVKLNENTNELLAPIGCKVEILNSNTTSTSVLTHWSLSTHNIAFLSPGFPKGDASDNEIDYTGMSFKFIREDGSYTVMEAGLQNLDGVSVGNKTQFVFREDVAKSITSGLSFNNCFSFGNGIESNRIKDDFNQPFITNGVRASTVTQEQYKEERRKNGLIYSGIYNSNSGVNNLNQFIMAEKITKDLNPTYGSIQKLFSRNSDLISFCEDKVLKILANKDALYNADGNTNLTATESVLGQTIPFVGEYGISTNPESFASESYRAYFTDKQRGTVLRLSKDGLTPISKAGMNDWFRDNLSNYNSLIGTYDSYKEDYNITLSNLPAINENFILDSFLDVGEASSDLSVGSLSVVTNPGVANGTSLQYLFETYKVNEYENSNNFFDWSVFNYNAYNLTTTTDVIHHAEIPYESLQEKRTYYAGKQFYAPVPIQYAVWHAIVTHPDGTTTTYTGSSEQDALNQIPGGTLGTVITQQSLDAVYWKGSTVGSTALDTFYYALYNSSQGDIFGTNATTTSFSITGYDYSSRVRRHMNHVDWPGSVYWPNINTNSGGSFVNEASPNSHPTINHANAWNSPGYSAHVKRGVNHVVQSFQSGQYTRYVSRCIVVNSNGRRIAFDRVDEYGGGKNFVEIRDVTTTTPSAAGINSNYRTNVINANPLPSYSGLTPTSSNIKHSSIYNGEELHIQLELRCYKTASDFTMSYDPLQFGYNVIKPKIQLYDGTTAVPSGYVYSPGGASTSIYENTESSPVWGTTGTSYSLTAANEYTCHRNQYSTAPYQVFPSTETISVLAPKLYTYPSTTFQTPITVKVSASFKFRDHTQQNQHGAPLGNQIQEKRLIEDLRIRISNDLPGGGDDTHAAWMTALDPYNPPSTTTGSTMTALTMMRSPLWEITRIKCVKGLIVDAPYTPEETFTVAAATSNPVLYDASGVGNPGSGLPGDPGQSYIAPIQAVDPVPPQTIPAWTEIIHNGFANSGNQSNWSISNWNSGQYSMENKIYSKFGENYNRTIHYGNKENSPISDPPIAGAIEYSAPHDWDQGASGVNPQGGDGVSDNNTINGGSPYGTSGNGYVPAGIGSHGYTYIRTNFNDNNYSATTNNGGKVSYDNDFIEISSATNTGIIVNYDISNDPWDTDTWYLVDVEFDREYGDGQHSGDINDPNSYPNIDPTNFSANVLGAGTMFGSAYLTSGSPISTILQTYGIDPNGVGIPSVPFNVPSVMLLLTKRIEYGNSNGSGDGRVVLRGIFKPDNSSSVITGLDWYGNLGQNGCDSNKLEIYFTGGSSSLKVNKIITKKLYSLGTVPTLQWATYTSLSGNASAWTKSMQQTPPVHAFQDVHVYYASGKLQWQVPAADSNGTNHWIQLFNTPQTKPSPTVSFEGWELSFTVNKNTTTNSFSGDLSGFVAIDDGTGSHEGVYFGGIQQEGNYLIKFNFDGNTLNYITDPNSTDTKPWEFLRADLVPNAVLNDFTNSSGIISSTQGQSNLASLTDAEIIDRIKFVDTPGQAATIWTNGTPQEYAVSDIQLTNSQKVFLGGSAGSWNFSGFNTSTDNYIYWDVDALNLVFDDCPPFITGDNEFININQQINKTIKRFEQYKIKFVHTISSLSDNTLSLYYYNTNGYGFKISGIDHSSGVNSGVQDALGNDIMEYDEIITIGVGDNINVEPTWNAVNQQNNLFAPNLKNSFVISVEGNSEAEIINGTIDAISMQLVITAGDFEGKTVTFNENAKGWTSFKSFVPENGLSVSKKYFTFKEGGLWKHYVPKVDNQTHYIQGEGTPEEKEIYYTSKEANNYNTFYDIVSESLPSSVTAVLNQEPSVVKTFNTLNYEGSQTYVYKPTEANYHFAYTDATDSFFKTAADQVNINNAEAFRLNSDILGWQCSEIITDLDAGTVKEFIKKEGKWFNYIKGKASTGVPNVNLFSVQGVGDIQSVVTEGLTGGGTPGPYGS